MPVPFSHSGGGPGMASHTLHKQSAAKKNNAGLSVELHWVESSGHFTTGSAPIPAFHQQLSLSFPETQWESKAPYKEPHLPGGYSEETNQGRFLHLPLTPMNPPQNPANFF